MNIQVDPTSSNLASAMLNSKIRPRAVVGYGVKIFHGQDGFIRGASPWDNLDRDQWRDSREILSSINPRSKFIFPVIA